ncbi:acyloxyacyl hydrolase [Sinorhizobium meliloti]|uniref:acyloxyacyl hydrolase n=1 Tax=Rhizobium meliloti TaxID=382 RepID=UPI000FD466C7|nr:acyloxyacyl hydrolase [Sinorhizobium meliloti]MDW9416009.1 acyloxyacyl hydrolase [Sinorhizobium meliloti]MDW9483475.1 acyloxyacyl hydrolase [Sinorhizobium meliloti]MDW9512557.1 acyloxyacyl hydrolase [Sinorhizobium meliloti]MDW9637501.1 acyloxyacyl hydrolase [Sinorhizobium meliloti]MDW9670376.1 acyloxyacyl hydrolase [Sinorhizobium meliloti]
MRDFRSFAGRGPFIFIAAALTLSSALIGNSQAGAAESVFDELRFGATTSIGDGSNQEDGVFPSVTVFFDPLGAGSANGLAEKILRPRIHAGASVATSSSGASEIYAGLSWDADITERFFIELGAGATVHDGDLNDDGSDGPKLGCRLLFREYAAAGYRFDDHWNLSATVEHASNANLCDGPNDGLTRAGLMLGYTF